MSKNSRLVVLALSTSVKTAPNPRVNAAPVVPGTKKFTSVTKLPTAVKSRWRAEGREQRRVARIEIVELDRRRTPAFAAHLKPVPGVEKTTPRGELTLKKSAGK